MEKEKGEKATRIFFASTYWFSRSGARMHETHEGQGLQWNTQDERRLAHYTASASSVPL